MESDVFFDYYLKSLRFYFRDVLEALVVLTNILSKERIVFSCGFIHSKGVVTGVEVCMNILELEKLNNLYKI